MIDGIPDEEPYLQNYTVLVPIQDSVQEFKVDSNPTAQYGLFTGGVVNITTRSGSNSFHGTAYEYLRNKVLNANYYFNLKNNIEKPPFTQNQYGVAVGGPILKNKAFVFFAWEKFSLRTKRPLTLTVPTSLMKQGIFSEISNKIYDPCGGTVTTGGVPCPSYSGPRTPFSNNTIPSTRIDPAAKVMLNLWPSPNLPGTVNNYAVNAAIGGDSNEYSGRVDYNLTQAQHLFYRYTYVHPTDPALDPFKNHTGFQATNDLGIQSALGYTYAISPKTVLDARLAWIRSDYELLPDQPIGQDLSQLGPNWGNLTSQLQFAQLPELNIDGGYTGGDDIGAMDNLQIHHMEDGFISGSLLKILGHNTLKFGGYFRTGKRFPAIATGNPAGSFNFDETFTAQSIDTTSTSGFGFASFLLGYPTAGGVTWANPVDELRTAFGFYAQNTQQLGKVTLNYGLRWDQPGRTHERNGLDGVWLPNQADPLLSSITNPVTNQSRPLTGQLVLTSTPAWPSKYEQDAQNNLLSPRFGFAYDLGHQATLSGGYGIFILASGISGLGGGHDEAFNFNSTSMQATLNGGVTPNATLYNPFDGVPIVKPAGRSPAFIRGLEGEGILVQLGHLPYAYTEQWNINVQKMIGSDSLVQVGYAGTKGQHLEMLIEQMNQLPDQYDSLGGQLLSSVSNPFYGVLPPTVGALGQPKVLLGQLLLPFPQFQSVVGAWNQDRSSWYNGLLASYQKRFHGGGTLLASYSFQKMTSDTDSLFGFFLDQQYGWPQDYNNPKGDWSEVGFDIPQRLVISYVWDLPIGQHQSFLANVHGTSGKLISGWTLNGITTFQSGWPLEFNALSTVLSRSFGAGGPRPDVVPGCKRKISGSPGSRLNEWFNTSCYDQPSQYGFGDLSRTDPLVRSMGTDNWDFSLRKSTSINDHLKLEFDTEFFNLFNRTEFSKPATVVGLPGFGTVTSQSNQPRLTQFALRLTF